jgi:hypothetical protein
MGSIILNFLLLFLGTALLGVSIFLQSPVQGDENFKMFKVLLGTVGVILILIIILGILI